MHDRPIAHTAQQTIGDARRAARTQREFPSRAVAKIHAQHIGRTFDELLQLVVRVEVKMCGETEACAQRTRQHALARGGADDGEPRQGQRNGAGARTLADHHVDAEILHRDVQQLLGGARQAVDLVDEQHLTGIKRTENRGEIAGVLDRRPGSDANRHFELVGHDHGQRGLAQTGWAGEQDMIGRHVPLARGVEEQLKLGFEPGLADESPEDMRAQFLIADRLVADRLRGDHA